MNNPDGEVPVSSEGQPDAITQTARSLDFSPDLRARIIIYCVAWRSRVPGWRLSTMGRLVTSEQEGVLLIEGALGGLADDRLRKIFDRHLSDERRHESLFLARLVTMQEEANVEPAPPPTPVPQKKRPSLLEAVAYLEIQEARAVALLAAYSDLFAGDDESVRALESASNDERYHAAWTHLQLERWAKEGMADEVESARANARKVDQRAFWAQLFGFLRVVPSLLFKGYLPPIRRTPSPMHA